MLICVFSMEHERQKPDGWKRLEAGGGGFSDSFQKCVCKETGCDRWGNCPKGSEAPLSRAVLSVGSVAAAGEGGFHGLGLSRSREISCHLKRKGRASLWGSSSSFWKGRVGWKGGHCLLG